MKKIICCKGNSLEGSLTKAEWKVTEIINILDNQGRKR